MCGLFGFIFHKSLSAKRREAVIQFFETLALVNVERGLDATGVALISKSGIHLHKRTYSVYSTLADPLWNEVLQQLGPKACMLLGHTRAGTHGANTVDNAHPFQLGELIGTHNGVILNHEELNKKQPFENDSKNLFQALSVTRTMREQAKVLRRVEGSLALAYWHAGYAYLARNLSSPCFVSQIPEIGASVYSSVKEGITWGAAVAGVEREKVVELPANRIFRWATHSETSVSEAFSDYMARPRFTRQPSSYSATPPVVHFVTEGPGLRPGERLTEYPKLPGNIACNECRLQSREECIRLINGRVICSFCWSKRLAQYPEPDSLTGCPKCGGTMTNVFVDHNDQLLCGSCYTGGVYMTEQGAV